MAAREHQYEHPEQSASPFRPRRRHQRVRHRRTVPVVALALLALLAAGMWLLVHVPSPLLVHP